APCKIHGAAAMNIEIIFAAGSLADTARETAEKFGLNLPQFIAQVISFAIVAVLLHRFVYKPILQMLEERKRRIAESLENAEKIKSELAKTEAARQEILSRANSDANKLIEEAKAAAARLQEAEAKKAIAMAEHIIQKAHEAAAADRMKMMNELRKEIGRLVVETTIKVTGKVLTPEEHKRLIEEANRALISQ
ncbi:MAG: F0F1 ATP synthase subunit B, partial [Limisphaerales bacterium]